MAGGKRNGSGRKRITINLEEVEKLAAIQCTEPEIASFFGISLRTFERRKSQPAVAEAIERGKARGRLSLRRSLWGLAQKGNPAGEHLPGQESPRLQGLLQPMSIVARVVARS
jgi:hypothetical protein